MCLLLVPSQRQCQANGWVWSFNGGSHNSLVKLTGWGYLHVFICSICTGYKSKCTHFCLGQTGSLAVIAQIKDIKHIKKKTKNLCFFLWYDNNNTVALITSLLCSKRALGQMHVSRLFWDWNSEVLRKIPVVIFPNSVGQAFTMFQTSDQKSPPEPCLTSNPPPAVWEPRAPWAVDTETTFAVSECSSALSSVTISDIRAVAVVSWKGNGTLEYIMMAKKTLINNGLS